MAEVRIEPITSTDDIPACAKLCRDAILPDPFHAFLERYNSRSFYDETITRLSDAINPANKTDFAFKAVLDLNDGGGVAREEIVGVSHWYVGYVVVPKVDPFVKKVVETGNEIGPGEIVFGDEGKVVVPAGSSQKLDKAKGVMDELYRVHGNLYVGKIRGKKHVYLRRMMVHPDHQRKGIGRKLLEWGLDIADKQKLVSWLYARPAAAKLYENAGFKLVGLAEARVAEGDEPLDVPPGMAMLREPQPYTGA